MTTLNQGQTKRVALIAVHGVGSPAKGETVRQVVELLQAESGDAVHYSPFSETPLHIPVEPVAPRGARSGDTQFSQQALGELDLTDEVRRYRTLKLSGTRTEDGIGSHHLDCYELYWEDFSSASSSMPRFLSELYQLMFHLASLGRKTVVQASDAGTSAALAVLSRLHRCVEAILPSAIPIGNFYLVPFLLAILPALLPGQAAPLAAALLWSTLAFAALYAMAYAAGRPALGWLALLPAAWLGMAIHERAIAAVALSLGLLLFGLALVWLGTRLLMSRYGETAMRRTCWASLAGALTLIALAWLMVEALRMLPPESTLAHDDAVTAYTYSVAATAFMLTFVTLSALWTVLALLLLLTCGLPFAARWMGLDAWQARAARTGRIGVMLSSTLFMITTLFLWSAIIHGLNQTALSAQVFTIPDRLDFGAGYAAVRLSSLADILFTASINGAGNLFLLACCGALLLAIAAVIPSAWFEAVPAKADEDGDAERQRREKLWHWLDHARTPLWAAELVLCAGWLVLILDPLLGAYVARLGFDGSETWFHVAGGVLAAAIPATLFFRQHLPNVATAVMDILLDVSNWLRERPWPHNPRGRIMARYISLLRNILKPAHYDRLLIVCYSQGTVISADTLKLLKETDLLPELRNVELVLLTLGSPLRQLYAARFPHWYGWAEQADPAALGVTLWANGYRSGDYVGRALWDGGPLAQRPAAHGDHYDFCVGVGAHLHYFDRTARRVGREIDFLVSQALTVASVPAP